MTLKNKISEFTIKYERELHDLGMVMFIVGGAVAFVKSAEMLARGCAPSNANNFTSEQGEKVIGVQRGDGLWVMMQEMQEDI